MMREVRIDQNTVNTSMSSTATITPAHDMRRSIVIPVLRVEHGCKGIHVNISRRNLVVPNGELAIGIMRMAGTENGNAAIVRYRRNQVHVLSKQNARSVVRVRETPPKMDVHTLRIERHVENHPIKGDATDPFGRLTFQMVITLQDDLGDF